MALGDPYITADDLATYLGVAGGKDKPLMENAVAAASDLVTDHCQRDFNTTTTATARVYETRTHLVCDVDDFHTTTDLVVKTDTGDNGTYNQTWTITTDFVLEPRNGVEAALTGFPYRRVIAVGSYLFPENTGRARVQVTAKWGWAAIPDKVKQATRILAAELYRLKDAPLGIAAAGEFGPLRVREVPQVALLLKAYQHPVRTGPRVG